MLLTNMSIGSSLQQGHDSPPLPPPPFLPNEKIWKDFELCARTSPFMALSDRDSILRPAMPCLCPKAWSIIPSLESTTGSCGDEHTVMSNKNTFLQSRDWQRKNCTVNAGAQSMYLSSLSSAKAMFVCFLFCTREACWCEEKEQEKLTKATLCKGS